MIRRYKILFLDIDGVLNSTQSMHYFYKRNGNKADSKKLCPICISNLLYIIEKVENIRIVISSTWRYLGLQHMKDVLSDYGIKSEYIIDITPRLNEYMCRGKEIKQWLDNNKDIVTSFVIVDDDSDMQPIMEHLVKTSNSLGLMWDKAQEIIERFNK